jgi:predicted Rossmann fold nucleotide-binding protein DprA/Smf involved in DNA uptake
MTTREEIAALEQKLIAAKSAYHSNLLAEVEQLNARLKAIDDELGQPVSSKVTLSPVMTAVAAVAKPQPKNALRIVKPRKTRAPIGQNRVLDALSAGPTTIQNIAAATGRVHSTVWNQVKALAKRGLVRCDDTQLPHVYSLASDAKPSSIRTVSKPATPAALSTGQMETLTALASGPSSLATLSTKLGVSSYSTLATLRHLKKLGLVRELTTTWPHRWEMVQGAGVAK